MDDDEACQYIPSGVLEENRGDESCNDDIYDCEDDPLEGAYYDEHHEDYTIELDILDVEDVADDDSAGSIYANDAELLGVLRQLKQYTNQYNDINDEDILRVSRIDSNFLSGSRWGDDVEEFEFVESML